MAATFRTVWVDHDRTKLKRYLKALGRQTVEVDGVVLPFSDVVEMHPVSIQWDRDCKKMAEQVLTAVEEFQDDIDCVLVDLFFGADAENNVAIGWKSGATLGLALRQMLPWTSVGVFTSRALTDEQEVTAILSSQGFSPLLFQVKKLIDDKMESSTWLEIFNRRRAARKRSEAAVPVFFSLPRPTSCEWGEGAGLPPRSFRTVCEVVGGRMLYERGARRLRFQQLSGGFSGSGVVSVENLDTKASFLLKLDERGERIEREFKGYNAMLLRAKPNVFLNPIDYSLVGDNWWGVLLLQFDGTKAPLVASIAAESSAFGDILERVWGECLYDFYGQAEIGLEGVDECMQVVSNAVAPLSQRTKAVWDAVGRQGRYADVGWDAIGKLISSGVDGLKDWQVNMQFVPFAHGDLNLRNILVDREASSFVLIDFPAVGRKTKAYDFVKVEAETVIIALGYVSGRDAVSGDFGNWVDLVTTLTRGNFVNDAHLEGVLGNVYRIRRCFLRGGAVDARDRRVEYLVALTSRVAAYLGYQDVLETKKALILVWLNELLDELGAARASEEAPR